MSSQTVSTSSVLDIPAVSHGNEIHHQIFGKEITIILGILIFLCVAVFHKFIFGTYVYLFNDIGGDTLNVYYPAYVNIADTIWGGDLPGWSFEQGLGQNIFPFSLSDPTVYFLYLLGSKNLPFGIIWVEIFKIIGSGLLFFSFLKKLRLDTNAAYIGSLLYAFSGFMIVGGSWYIFSTLGLYLALLLLSFEMLFLENKWWLFPIAVSMISAYNFVSLYTCSLFLVLYSLFRLFAQDGVSFNRIPALFMKLVLLYILGMLISSVFSIPNLHQMLGGPRVSGAGSYAKDLYSLPAFELGESNYLLTILMRTFSSDLLGNGSAFKGWYNYLEAPMAYCGLICLLLVFQIFGFLKARQKIAYGLFIGIFLFSEIFPWFRRAFWLFQGEYFRDFSLYVSVILILFSMLALDQIIKGRKVNHWLLATSLLTMVVLLYFHYDLDRDIYGNSINWQNSVAHSVQRIVLFFLVLIATCLLFFSAVRWRKYVPLCLLVITITELATLSYKSVNMRDAVEIGNMHQKLRFLYDDNTIDAVTFIKQQDRDFFRIEKNYGGFNDPKVQHYFGSSSYSSFNQPNYIGFLGSTGVLNPQNETETRWVDGVKNYLPLQLLTAVKYFLFKGNLSAYPTLTNLYSKIGSFGDVTVLKSRYALPLGVAYDSYMIESEFNGLDTQQKQSALLKAIVIPDDLAVNLPAMNKISKGGIATFGFDLAAVSTETNELSANSLHIEHFSNNRIDGKIDNKIRQLVFFSFPFDRGWQAKVNGREVPLIKVDGGLSAVMVDPGNNFISLQYIPPFVKEGLLLSVLGMIVFVMLLFRPNIFR